MQTALIIISIPILVALLGDIFLLIYVLLLKEQKISRVENLTISILVPARNESLTVENTLQSLLRQDYPKHKTEVLVGDDSSLDNTADLVKEIEKSNPLVKYYYVDSNKKVIGGKAGVLEVLIKKASGEIILVADADMVYPASWASTMGSFVVNKEQLVSGFTCVEGSYLWAQWQNIDWLMNLTGVKILAEINFKLTAIGNNMAFAKSAYNKIPGFGEMENFVTEDMELLRQMQKSGVDASLIFSREILGITQPSQSLRSILAQRLRWMSGAMRSPFWLRTIWFLRIMLLPMAISFLILSIYLSLIIWTVHLVLFGATMFLLLRKLNLKTSLLAILFFEFFYFLINCLTLSFHIFRKRINWKDRYYPQ